MADKGLKYVGENPIKGMALGSQEGHKLYLGETLIWEDPIIEFDDDAVEAICVANWGGSVYSGKITQGEAAKVTSLNDAFYGNTDIVKFNELRYFTGLTSLYSKSVSGYPTGQFYNCTKLQEVTIPHANITGFKGAFRGCGALKSLDITPTKGTSLACGGMLQLGSAKTNFTYLKLAGVQYRSGMQNFAYRRSGLTTIEIDGTADFSEVTAFSTTAFGGCSALETIRSTVEGVPPITGISKNISFAASPNLTHDTLLVILNGLADLTGSTQQTLTLHSTAKARLTADDMAIAQNKNWQIA